MGYRPSIYVDGELMVEFGKFYGYVDHNDLKSIKWLEDHKKIELPDIDGDDHGWIFYYSNLGPEIEFTADEFREFWDLYIQDINDHDFSNDGIKYDKPFDSEITWKKYSCLPGTFKEMIYDTEKTKVIEWG